MLKFNNIVSLLILATMSYLSWQQNWAFYCLWTQLFVGWNVFLFVQMLHSLVVNNTVDLLTFYIHWCIFPPSRQPHGFYTCQCSMIISFADVATCWRWVIYRAGSDFWQNCCCFTVERTDCFSSADGGSAFVGQKSRIFRTTLFSSNLETTRSHKCHKRIRAFSTSATSFQINPCFELYMTPRRGDHLYEAYRSFFLSLAETWVKGKTH